MFRTIQLEDAHVEIIVLLYETRLYDIKKRLSEIGQEQKELQNQYNVIESYLNQLKLQKENTYVKSSQNLIAGNSIPKNSSNKKDTLFSRTTRELSKYDTFVTTSFIVDNIIKSIDDPATDRRKLVKKVSHLLGLGVKNGSIIREQDNKGEYVYSLKDKKQT